MSCTKIWIINLSFCILLICKMVMISYLQLFSTDPKALYLKCDHCSKSLLLAISMNFLTIKFMILNWSHIWNLQILNIWMHSESLYFLKKFFFIITDNSRVIFYHIINMNNVLIFYRKTVLLNLSTTTNLSANFNIYM